jgi:hypothetical protein
MVQQLVLSKALPDFFCPERANTVEAEGEHQAILISEANIESVVLCRDGAALPGIADRRG